MSTLQRVQSKFKELYGGISLVVASPGRINLIGEHTDYNEGWVMPAAIDKKLYLALGPSVDQNCHIYAMDLDQHFSFSSTKLRQSKLGWPNYLMGVVDELLKLNKVPGPFHCVFSSDIPLGAGLSSSAALECGLAFGLNEFFDLNLSPLAIALLGQAAENNFVGLNCGLMDQYASVMGKKKQVLLLDCRYQQHEYLPFDFENISIVLCNTGVAHSLADSAYNERRTQCEAGVAFLQERGLKAKSLRDIDLETWNSFSGEIDPLVFQRCQYVLEENERVHKSTQLLKAGNLPGLGMEMYASHEGLQKKYEVSCDELDFLVEESKKMDYVFGARMMGGGFGGCTINLVENQGIEEFSKQMKMVYKNFKGIDLQVYVTQIAEGNALVE